MILLIIDWYSLCHACRLYIPYDSLSSCLWIPTYNAFFIAFIWCVLGLMYANSTRGCLVGHDCAFLRAQARTERKWNKFYLRLTFVYSVIKAALSPSISFQTFWIRPAPFVLRDPWGMGVSTSKRETRSLTWDYQTGKMVSCRCGPDTRRLLIPIFRK